MMINEKIYLKINDIENNSMNVTRIISTYANFVENLYPFKSIMMKINIFQ